MATAQRKVILELTPLEAEFLTSLLDTIKIDDSLGANLGMEIHNTLHDSGMKHSGSLKFELDVSEWTNVTN